MKLPKEAFQAGCIFKRPSPQPGTSTQVVTGLVKTPGSPNQEQQGRNTQSLTMDEIRERALILVSDNNFNKFQRTQILAFKLKIETPVIRLWRVILRIFNR